MSEQKNVTIVALVALQEEYEVFSKIFPFKQDLSINTFENVCVEHQTESENIRLISILSQQMGAESARDSAELAIREFSPDMVVIVGIAGGISSDLSVGDVCVSNTIYDVLNNNKITEISEDKSDLAFSPKTHGVNVSLVAAFTFLQSHPLLTPEYEKWRLEADICDEEAEDYPKFMIAPIVCGAVSASKNYNKKLKDIDRKTGAIETESGGVFQALSRCNIPAIAVRGISDLADLDKASLEKRTKGSVRVSAMKNACLLLKTQFNNNQFLEVAKRFSEIKTTGTSHPLKPVKKICVNPIEIVEEEILSNLVDLYPEFRSRPDGFYLPIPRASKIFQSKELEGKELDAPIDIIDCLKENDRILLKMPRSFPTQNLGWSLAHSLLRQQIDGRVIIPLVVDGNNIRPPSHGLKNDIEKKIENEIQGPEYLKLYIIEEPRFDSRTRMSFFNKELNNTDAKILVLTKSEDNISSVNDFIQENLAEEYQLTPVSFSETAFFLEQSFGMPSHEAESIAIKLDETFRKFRLDAHPTYFAGLQEDTLAALINANKRAELIQMAVDGLLSLIVAADNSQNNLNLGRTARERFLKSLVLKMAKLGDVDDGTLSDLARDFLDKYKFDISQTEFLNPFFKAGLLHKADGKIWITHPYLESYLLAQALGENTEFAKEYFDPEEQNFNYYAFDLYCEIEPDESVLDHILNFSKNILKSSNELYTEKHIYTLEKKLLVNASSKSQIQSFAARLSKSVDKIDSMDNGESTNEIENIRNEKQRILDTRREVQKVIAQRESKINDNLEDEIRIEFEILEKLSRSLSLCIIAVGSGAESIKGDYKVQLAETVLELADRFTDIWTRNRQRVDFDNVRSELLKDEKIWEFMETIGAEEGAYDKVKLDLELFLDQLAIYNTLDPMRRVIWRICASAGSPLLAPVLSEIEPKSSIESIIKACWIMDVSPEKGSSPMKSALNSYKGSSLIRLVLANHFIARVYWHYYRTVRSPLFLQSARKALAPLGLKPGENKIKQAQKGAND